MTTESRLSLPTGVQRIISEFIAGCEQRFPEVFVDFYLCGSQLDGSANRNSDIDLLLVVESPASEGVQQRFGEFLESFNRAHWPVIGPAVYELSTVTDLPGFAKFAHHLQGRGSFRSIPLQSLEQTTRHFIHGSFKFISRFLREADRPLAVPVGIPDPKDPLLGYRFPDGPQGKSSKRLVSAIARFCGALIALHWGIQPASKRMSIETYAQRSDCPYHDWVRETCHRLTSAWEYRVPETAEGRAEFLDMLRTFNDFENHLLETVTPWLEQVEAGDPQSAWIRGCREMIRF